MTVLTYNGYQASVTYEDGVINIRLLHIDDYIATCCEAAGEVEAAFRELVDDYLETCAELGRPPQKPYKGSLNVRLAAELHREAAMAAAQEGVSINGFIVDAITDRLKKRRAQNRQTSVDDAVLSRNDLLPTTIKEWVLAGHIDLSAYLVTPNTTPAGMTTTADHTVAGGSDVIELSPYLEKRRA